MKILACGAFCSIKKSGLRRIFCQLKNVYDRKICRKSALALRDHILFASPKIVYFLEHIPNLYGTTKC